ncbi:IPT/TIG domain-containing protein [Segatella copri]|uniref:IPT/TIG domain-containing protein n=1 Tax=Segatella copri TaxID=165179 RepID=A0AAW5I8Q3_9BACT|nr:IPT/TIG domain-containing protein [Segatella copri]MCP9544879.1 IPT/TIG domain-containing protein [Segatella copri]MCP9548149.1 IPT/TIG domain-containing protein [Segatella copri]MCP9554216.1 IPT/TIG domain-containing protein [Segatella copri]MCP9568892.1 IPT/TIG domain-containing protein [Segatella copri]
MKRHNKSFLWLVLLLICSTFAFTSCDRDDLNTDQYGNEISVLSYGPNPVLRGGVLTFKGANLDQITEIDLPGAEAITSINVVTSGKNSEINIEVPAEKCEPGIVTLKTAKNGEIKTLTPITYIENLKFTGFYVGENKENLVGNVGDVLTIEGDYLNNITSVIFANGATMDAENFKSQTRYQIQLVIPAEAGEGRFQISDGNNYMYSEGALSINAPEIDANNAIGKSLIKAGETEVLRGTSLDQIASIELNGATVEAADFKSQTASEITFIISSKVADGEITAVTKSGIRIPFGEITTVVPSQLVATPSPIKNGAELTITGKDMDLITGIAFPNAKESKLNKVETTKVTSTVPEDAQEGNITLSLDNGKTVAVAYTLVKPTVTACTPAAITAGEKTIIKGTDLDLVKSVTFPGDVEQTVEKFAAQNANAIAVTVPAACAGTGFKLNLKNGTTINIDGQLSIKAATDPAIASVTPGEAIAGSTITITGKNFQNIQNLYIGSYKVNRYTSRTNTEIVCQVPANAEVGTYKIVMEDPDGNKIEGPEFKVVPAEKDIATITTNIDNSAIKYPYNFTWDDTGRFRIMKADLIKLGVKVGSKMLFYKEAGATGQVQINNANWGAIDTVSDWDGNKDCIVKVFDAAMMEAVNSISDGWGDTAFILQGDLKNVTKIAILP